MMRNQGIEVLVEGGGQAAEDIFEIDAGVVALRVGTFDQSVEDAGGMAAGGFATGAHSTQTGHRFHAKPAMASTACRSRVAGGWTVLGRGDSGQSV
jgi:hypothetical protein